MSIRDDILFSSLSEDSLKSIERVKQKYKQMEKEKSLQTKKKKLKYKSPPKIKKT